MTVYHTISRRNGDEIIVAQAQRQIQTFFDELKNGTRNYRTIASLDSQISQEYRGRCILELLQNAHDALREVPPGEPRQISFMLKTSPQPVLLVANSGDPFRRENFYGLCQLGQSPKNPNQSVGNKGLGFRSVLEISTCPEIWSTPPIGGREAFVFRFDPDISERIEIAARDLDQRGLNARSPFDSNLPLLDWSEEQLSKYRDQMMDDSHREVKKFLSPYSIPLPIQEMIPEVEFLLEQGYVTIIRLPLNSGGSEKICDVVNSVRNQLDKLDCESMVFLSHVEKIIIDINGEQRILERMVESDDKFSDRTQYQRQHLLIGQSESNSDNCTTTEFRVWTRVIGGEDDTKQADEIRAVVEGLPNLWPEVRRVVISIAVEDAPSPANGRFVIFLPTEMTTGTGALINAPFYSSLDRRSINFQHSYNDLILKGVFDLCIDAVIDLVSEEPEQWRARSIIDLLSSSATVGGHEWCFMDKLINRALDRGILLETHNIILCDEGWCIPSNVRYLPVISEDIPVGLEYWRTHAAFTIVSTLLDDRDPSVKALIMKLDGLLDPTDSEWGQTINQVAVSVQKCKIDVDWNGFLKSLIAILPSKMKDESIFRASDPLATVKFLPDQDERLLSVSGPIKLFFRPVHGIGDDTDLIEHVPDSLKHRIAFLHPDVRTTQQELHHRNTPVQKFLDGRFVRSFRREDILREIVLQEIPELPVVHGSKDADLCSELLLWTFRLLGEGHLDTLPSFLERLPVPCYGGWFSTRKATFGPGWLGRCGDHIWDLAEELPEDMATRLRETALLPPDDSRWGGIVEHPRWGGIVEHRGDFFARLGVFDGLRLNRTSDIPFHMSRWNYELPSSSPPEIPQKAWDDWRHTMRKKIEPYYTGNFNYSLTEVYLLPEIHQLDTLNQRGRKALSHLLLMSLPHWPDDWQKATIKKQDGQNWSRPLLSPLNYWLSTQQWLLDETEIKPILSQCWLIPTSLLSGQTGRFRYLNSLSFSLSCKLEANPELRKVLTTLGLNMYPAESEQIGPKLLEALADAWETKKVPTERFDIFLGQLRDAWDRFDPQKGLPKSLLVRTERRMFLNHALDELADVYLPDNRDRARSLLRYGQYILEMNPHNARRLGETLVSRTKIRLSSVLEEKVLIDGLDWTGTTDGLSAMKADYPWLPVTLLAIAAYGGPSTGPETQTWRDVRDRLHRARVIKCGIIVVQLVDDDKILVESESNAEWLSDGDVLAMQRDVGLSYEKLATAAQGILRRQDLIKDLRLVLDRLSGQENPTRAQIEDALERADIDAQMLTNIYSLFWMDDLSLLVDRIRPVIELLDISDVGFDAAASDVEHLEEWLSSNLSQWSASEIIEAARRSPDDYAMGLEAWSALGDIAQLPAWNAALTELGDQYVVIENPNTDHEATEHIEAISRLLRCFARHVAIEMGESNLFRKIEAVSQNFKAYGDWSTRWWKVPFTAVLDALRTGYMKIPGVIQCLGILENITNLEEFRLAFQDCKITTDLDPYEIARQNKIGLENMLSKLHEFHQVWLDPSNSTLSVSESPQSITNLDPDSYLNLWSEVELLRRAFHFIECSEFVAACNGCASLDEIRNRLALDPKAVEIHRHARQKREVEHRRQKFDIAGISFEVGITSPHELFNHLNSLPNPVGPCVNQDTFTPLTIPSFGTQSNASDGKKEKTFQMESSFELRYWIGIIGEIHAYRFLRQEFGDDTITPDAWISKIRLEVLPLVAGEPDKTDDGHGFDFQFSYQGVWWHIEVKSTIGDDPQFDLGISQIGAATDFAQKQGGIWRILRVRNALSDKPEFDWLPNPFEEEFKKYFRRHQGGIRVSYVRKEI